MTFRIGAYLWSKLFFGTVVLFTLIIGGTNYWIDYYGLFRDASEENLFFYGNERTSKYLYSFQYIPQNYDGLVVGSSFSNNWDVSLIRSAHVYNGSLDGANISEEKLIFDNFLKRGKIRLLVVGIYPHLTADHGRRSGYMDPSEYWGALGSLQLFREYATQVLVKIGARKNYFGSHGRYAFELDQDYRNKFYANPDVGRGDGAFTVSNVAVREYEELLSEAREGGAMIVGVVPPIYLSIYNKNRENYEAYIEQMSALFEPSEKIINFNSAPYFKYVNDPKTFQDGIHLTTKAADIFSGELAAIVDAL